MRSVGIHVDSRKIRILELEIASKKLTLENLFEMDRVGDESLSEILKNYFTGVSANPDSVIASVGNVPSLTRYFLFPFRDRRKVQQAILGEFEDTLPIEIDQYVLEFQPQGRGEGGLNKYIGALISKEPVEDMNHVFEKIDILPSDFLIPSEAYARLGLSLLYGEFPPGSVVCLVDLGFDATQIAIVRFPTEPSKKIKASAFLNSVIDFRHIARGSKEIYDREATRQALTVREFEDWIISRSSFQEGAAHLDDYKNAMRPLLVELYQITQAAFSKSGLKVDHFVLTGPLSCSPGFRDFFEHELRTPTLLWDPFQKISATKEIPGAAVLSRFTVPLSLAMRNAELKSLPWLNFRRSSQKKKIISAALDWLASPEVRKTLVPASLMAVLVTFLSLGGAFLLDSRLQKMVDRTHSALTHAKAPLGSNKEKLASDPDSVAEKFEAFKTKRFNELPNSHPLSPTLDHWLKLSQTLPANAKVEEMKIAGQKTSRQIIASLDLEKSTQKPEEIKQALEGRGFKDVSITPQNGNKYLLKARAF